MDWEKNWDPDVGMWWANGPGHTQATKNLDRLHSGVTAAGNLVTAAREGILGQVEAALCRQVGGQPEYEKVESTVRHEAREHQTPYLPIPKEPGA